jgi:carbonic anhydrase
VTFAEYLSADLTTSSCNFSVNWNSDVYTMRSVNFHSPSEHTLGGGYYAGEVEFVHESAAGEMLVISVLLEEGQSAVAGGNNNVLLDVLRNNFYDTDGNETAFNPYEITPGSKAQYYYEGSLTVPPCVRNVSQFIFVEPVTVSSDDVALIRGVADSALIEATDSLLNEFGGNNRETFPLNNRKVIYFNNEVIATPRPSNAPTEMPTESPTTYQERPEPAAPRPELATSEARKVQLGVILSSVALGASGLIALFLGWLFYRYICRGPADIRREALLMTGCEGEIAVEMK